MQLSTPACLAACSGGSQAQEPQLSLDNVAAHDLCVHEHQTAGDCFAAHDLDVAEQYIMQVLLNAVSLELASGHGMCR